jgi:crotonobetainyl-CoA:carnitine CoA-transferase CaiB-like acyl-CoA transferase
VYRAGDGRFLAVGALEPKFWLAFNAAIGRAGDPSELIGDDAQQDAVRAEIQAILLQKTRDQWIAHFAALGSDVCVEPVLELDELSQHPVHASREQFFSIAASSGTRSDGTPIPPLSQVRTPALPPHAVGQVCPPPQLGEHSFAILQEAGFSAEEIRRLQQSGAARLATGSGA